MQSANIFNKHQEIEKKGGMHISKNVNLADTIITIQRI
jgi:hypothetical protein